MQKADTTTIRTNFFIQYCVTCGVMFGVTEGFDGQRKWDGRRFYCPNGHSQSYRAEKGKGKDANKPTRDRKADAKKIRELHELEQAEARIADKAAKENGATPACEPNPSHPDVQPENFSLSGLTRCDDPAKALEWTKEEYGWRTKCRLCKPVMGARGMPMPPHEYKHAGMIARHMREKHQLNMTKEQCRASAAAAIASEQEGQNVQGNQQ